VTAIVSPATLVAERGLTLPLQLTGVVRRWNVQVATQRVRIAGIGREKLIDPICARLFSELPRPIIEARRMLWSADTLVDAGADLVIAEVHRWMAPRFRRNGWLTIPEAVRWQGRLDQVPDDSVFFRLADYTIVHTTDPAAWEEFYQEMVVPQARSRFGPEAWVPSRRLMAEFARMGTLHMVSRDGVRVAGTCSVRQGETISLILTAVRQGDARLVEQGAGTAAVSLTLDWARRRDCRRVDLGRTGPFFNDEKQQSKRKWGLSPVPDPLADIAAIWVASPSARRAFAREPILVEHDTGLRGYTGLIS
jgi:GNAT acetyltransferase-like protein